MSVLSIGANPKTLCDFISDINSKKTLDLSDKDFIEPIFVAILSLIDYQDIKTDPNKNSTSYLSRLKDPAISENLLPLMTVDSRAQTEKAASEMVRKLNLTEEDGKLEIKYIIEELLINSLDHGNSKATTYSQIYQKLNEIEIGIVDRGVGFLKTLSRVNKAIQTDGEALKYSIKKGVSGAIQIPYSNAQKHAGMGLFVISEMIKDSQGKMLIVSGNSMYDVVNDRLYECSRWDGSIVYMRFNRDNFSDRVSNLGINYYVRLKVAEDNESIF